MSDALTSHATSPVPVSPTMRWQSWFRVVYVTVGAMTVGWAVGWLAVHVAHDGQPKWLLARVAGLTALVLLTALVSLGLALSHPRGTVLHSLPRGTLISLHIGLAAFTAVFTALHIVVLAIDEYAGVGWAGVLLPMGADYRPLPVTLGWFALYGGLAAGLTARFAGRLGRLWWPVHRVAIITYGAAWLHGVLSGTDSAAMGLFYAASMLIVLSIAASRYLTDPIRRTSGGVR